VEFYNLVALKRDPYQDQGGYPVFDYTWPKTTINIGIGTITGQGIGLDGAGKILSTNHLVVTPACKPVTSYPIAP
jgi:hypothetical protein